MPKLKDECVQLIEEVYPHVDNNEDITENIFVYIENTPELLNRYNELLNEFNPDAVKQWMGKMVKEVYGLTNLEVVKATRTTLIENYTKHDNLPQKAPSQAIGKAGELWVASALLFQGSDRGYRISTVDIDDNGTDLFLFRQENNAIKEMYELQIKTARTEQKNRYAYFGMQRPLKKGMKNLERIYIFIYAPKDVKYCWVLTEEEINKDYDITESVRNISFTVREDSQAKGVKYRCSPSDLFSAIMKKVELVKAGKE